MTATAAVALPNSLKYEDILKRMEEFGNDAAKGRDSQMKSYLTLLEGAFQGGIDLDASKHGQGVDDATKLAEAYAKKAGGMFDVKEPKSQVLVSKFRTTIKLGMWPKGGPGEPLTVANKLVNKWQELGRNPATRKMRQDAANAFLKFARHQLKQDSVVPDDQLERFCYKPGSEQESAMDVLVNAGKKLQKLYDGKIAGNTVQLNTQDVKDAIHSISKARAALVAQKNPSAVKGTK